MDYKKIYTRDYFSGKDSFFYRLGYGRFQKFRFKNLFRPLKPYLKKIRQGRILDVGCAYGFMLQKFPDSFEKFGIDISDYAIAKAKKKVPNAILRVWNAEEEFPFPQKFFDIVICNDVLEHLEHPSAALENIHKVLKKNGIFYINTPNLNWIRKKICKYPDKKEHHISLIPHQILLNLLNEIGFNIIDHWTYSTIIPFLFQVKFDSNLGCESAFICEKL